LRESIPVHKAILYGSYAYGTPRGGSDIDLVVLSPAFGTMPYLKRLEYLALAAWHAQAGDIEAIGYTPEEYETASSLSLLGEVRERGIVVYDGDKKSKRSHRKPSAVRRAVRHRRTSRANERVHKRRPSL